MNTYMNVSHDYVHTIGTHTLLYAHIHSVSLIRYTYIQYHIHPYNRYTYITVGTHTLLYAHIHSLFISIVLCIPFMNGHMMHSQQFE